MSDLYLEPTSDGGELVIVDGDPQTTSALETAVYLSLFTPAFWGNAIAAQDERYDSAIPELLDRTLTNQTRLAIIDAAKSALKWMTDDGIATSVEVDSEIPSIGVLYLSITITEPDGDVDTFAYAVNWAAQEVALR